MSSDIERRNSGEGGNLPAVDFSSVLVRLIGEIKEDPAQQRNAVYELARIKLHREAWQRNPPVTLLEMRRMMLALDAAIERVETQAAQQDELRALQSVARTVEPLLVSPSPPPAHNQMLVTDPPPMFMPPISMREPGALPAVSAAAPTTAQGLPGFIGATIAPMVGGAITAMVALGLYVAVDRQFDLFGRRTPPALAAAPVVPRTDVPTAEPRPVVPTPMARSVALPSAPVGEARVGAAGLPLPGVYGVYAVSDGQLAELQALPGRVPDQKVFMSTAIKTPSQATLPVGRIAFIIYRRDIAASAPERVQVRVIARIMRAMTFSAAGQANTASVDDTWTIRGNAYDLRVAPVPENAEMLMLRPENSDFVFPAGRYGLVLKGQAYDFTVAGAITEAAQCLERIEAANGAFYAECRKP